ncbi:sigma-70 family RNA polymerase sigma factor [Piscinibacter sp.]|uniref:sigma-70 family RNA polymerase sigma factor n=1 Tax=Piscinibacter sp. TaxID=1903157 RepID=UPI0039E4ADE6
MTSPVVHARVSLLASFQDSYRELLRYLARRTGSADDARDLVHDLWLRVAEAAGRERGPVLRNESEARAYLFTMARHLAIDLHRRDGVAQRRADEQRPRVDTQMPDAAESVMYGQAIDAVEAALASLPERPRQVFLRHRVQGEDQAALAQAFGVSRNMVERDMMLAMDRVQAGLEQWRAGTATATSATRGEGRRRSLTALLSLAGAAVAGVGGWRWWRLAVPQWEQAAATRRGQTLRQSLPDGSVVTLDAQTRVQLAYYGAWRSARLLTGAAFFEVAADAQRPFVVDVPPADDSGAQAVRITVLGTRFGVERLPGGAVEVQVESGRVKVSMPGGAGSPHELGAGDVLRWAPGSQEAAVESMHNDRPQQAAAWRRGVVVFDDVPLGDAVERLRRYLPRVVEVDPAAAGLRLSGQVRIAQSEDFLRALPGIVPVRSRLEPGGWHIQAL